jgi:hypothetical protein
MLFCWRMALTPQPRIRNVAPEVQDRLELMACPLSTETQPDSRDKPPDMTSADAALIGRVADTRGRAV